MSHGFGRSPWIRSGTLLRIAVFSAALLFAVFSWRATGTAASATPALPAQQGIVRKAPPVVEIVADGYKLEVPDTLRSGWTTFRFTNRADMTHFFVLERLPDGKTVADSRAEVIPVFQLGMDSIFAGKRDVGMAQFGKLPSWYSKVIMMGGVGLLAPGAVGETTLDLQPGTYAVECYVKTPGGKFHSKLGMLEGLVVSDEANGGTEPSADFSVTVANDGLRIDGTPKAGTSTFAVHFADQQAHANFVGHDVQLARLSEETDIAALSEWMDWSAPKGLTTPAPVRFLGGAEEMPSGGTAYVTAQLTPGRYALVAEVTNPLGNRLLQTFVIPR